MSLFQCSSCGCCDNTALALRARHSANQFDWTGIEDREGQARCAAPALLRGTATEPPTGLGHWHGEFPRYYLPKDKFRTNQRGNLENVDTGSEDYRSYALPRSPEQQPVNN